MKSMLIAAAIVGTTVAGLLLYLRKTNNKTMLELPGNISDGQMTREEATRLPQHSMG